MDMEEATTHFPDMDIVFDSWVCSRLLRDRHCSVCGDGEEEEIDQHAVFFFTDSLLGYYICEHCVEKVEDKEELKQAVSLIHLRR